MHQPRVVFGLGSNLGRPIEHLRQALYELRRSNGLRVLSVSSIYESDAQLPAAAPPSWNRHYLNAAVLCEFNNNLDAEDLLNLVKNIEKILSRAPSEKWAPRLIDIDILFWSRGVYSSERLNIPHQSLLERPFALLPLLELWPDIHLDKPAWASGWARLRPFNTQISRHFFWPRLVGILNVTPDSFSDGRSDIDEEFLQKRATELVSQGADILDIGAESTRPGATDVSEELELARLRLALSSLHSLKFSAELSIDCRRPKVVQEILLDYKLDYINDVSGFSDPEMIKLLKSSGCKGFVMHSISVPPRPGEVISEDQNPFFSLCKWWANKKNDLDAAGVKDGNLIFDMGIGFAKTSEQSLYLLKNLDEFYPIQNEIMVGHSRKSYLKLIGERHSSSRDMETALVTQQLNFAFVQYLRIHDLESQKIALLAGAFL